VKISPRVCRHCKSPAKGNPCFWQVDRPVEWAGFDAPCDGDRYDERTERADRSLRRTGLALAVAALVVLVWLIFPAKAHAYPCELIREHRATIEAMDSKTKRTWIKRLKISKSQVRKAARCLRG
jgi:hypothetical protein